jgi:hypothetical protein
MQRGSRATSHATRVVHVRQRRLRDEDDVRELDDLRAVARPPFAPAVRTDIVPRPLVRDDVERLEVVFRAVARPPFAPAAFFCARVPARPPRAPAARTLIVPRPVDDFRAVVPLRLAVFRLAVFRDVVLRAVVFRGVDLRAVVLRVLVFREAVFRDDVFREVAPRVEDVLRRLDEVFLLRAELAVLRPREDEPPLLDEDRDEDEPPDDDFVSPAWARCLFTVRAAISLARPVERPCFFSESLMCSYWRSRFELHAR